MLKMIGFPSRTTRAFLGALFVLLTLAGVAAATPPDLREIGAAGVQGGGFWGVDVTVRENLIAAGQTYARVTDEDCAAPSESAIVFETYLQPAESGDGTWAGLLAPVGPVAERLVATRLDGQVYMEPAAGGGTRVTAYLEGMPDGRTLRLCMGFAG